MGYTGSNEDAKLCLNLWKGFELLSALITKWVQDSDRVAIEITSGPSLLYSHPAYLAIHPHWRRRPVEPMMSLSKGLLILQKILPELPLLVPAESARYPSL